MKQQHRWHLDAHLLENRALRVACFSTDHCFAIAQDQYKIRRALATTLIDLGLGHCALSAKYPRMSQTCFSLFDFAEWRKSVWCSVLIDDVATDESRFSRRFSVRKACSPHTHTHTCRHPVPCHGYLPRKNTYLDTDQNRLGPTDCIVESHLDPILMLQSKTHAVAYYRSAFTSKFGAACQLSKINSRHAMIGGGW